MLRALLFSTLSLLQAPPADPLADLLVRFRADDQAAYHELLAAGEKAVDGVVLVMNDAAEHPVTRFMAANLLGDLGSSRAVEPLIAALQDPYYNHRRCAALALGKLRDERARKPLEELARNDPFVHHDPDEDRDYWLVREDARAALELLDGRSPEAAGLVREAETFLEDASVPPPSPVEVPVTRLSYPFPGSFREQNIFNNYQQPTDGYVHAGLDIMNEVGTEVCAVDAGWVAVVATNYPDWKTHHFFVVAAEEDGDRGWCYTHVDPDTYAFQVGERVERGQVLGRLVDFRVGANEGADHLHLNYVRFARKASGAVDTDSLVDPQLFFERTDTVAPAILPQVRFVRAGTLVEFAPQDGEPARVHGDVDVIAGISDAAWAGHGCNWMAAVVTLEISDQGVPSWRKLVLDQRGEIGDVTAASALYLKHADKQRWLEGVPAFPIVHFVIATHSDGDGRLESADRLQHWRTAERDAAGRPRFPNGSYDVTIRAFDLALNRAERTVSVRVENP